MDNYKHQGGCKRMLCTRSSPREPKGSGELKTHAHLQCMLKTYEKVMIY